MTSKISLGYNEAVVGKTKLKSLSFSVDLHLRFFESIPSGTASRESLASSQINKVQYSMYTLFRALTEKKMEATSDLELNLEVLNRSVSYKIIHNPQVNALYQNKESGPKLDTFSSVDTSLKICNRRLVRDDYQVQINAAAILKIIGARTKSLFIIKMKILFLKLII